LSYRARITKLRARAGCSPRAKALASRSNGGGAGVRWGDGATVVDSGCARKHSGERGPGAAGMERAHRRVSRVADGKGKLTVALDGARAQRRPQNRQWTSARQWRSSRFTQAERERGRGGWAEAQMREGMWASRARGSGMARERAVMGVSTAGRSWARG
jgi:hypothetical protein